MGIIELKNLKKSFGDNVVFENANLDIEKGSVIGIVGENGAGKSVLFKIMVGILRATEGEVYIRGEKIGKKVDFPENVGIFINSPGYIEILSGYKNLEFLASIRNVISKDDIVNAMIKVGLKPENKTAVKNYSLGMKQKLGIAQAIMENQDILILDEPFNALDFKTKNEIMQLLMQLHSDGKTIIITSHNFTDIDRLCDKIYLIDDCMLTELTNDIKEKYIQGSNISSDL